MLAARFSGDYLPRLQVVYRLEDHHLHFQGGFVVADRLAHFVELPVRGLWQRCFGSRDFFTCEVPLSPFARKEGDPRCVPRRLFTVVDAS